MSEFEVGQTVWIVNKHILNIGEDTPTACEYVEEVKDEYWLSSKKHIVELNGKELVVFDNTLYDHEPQLVTRSDEMGEYTLWE